MQHAQPDPVQRKVAAFLGDPRSHGGAAVERVDTHAAMVFLAGDRAYKLKRAVRYPYLDFSTVERRHAACVAELALNRRTAPTLYLGVAPVLRRAGGLALGGDGTAPTDQALDWVVVMRRFPADALLERMAERSALTDDLMRALADAVAAFHQAAERRTDGGGATAMRAVVDGNLRELRESPALFPPDRVERLASRSISALERLAPLMEARRANGFVRHGHGDLHLRNIVLLDGRPTLFDGIEFDESLAVIDVVYDLAFLLMDLEQRGLRIHANTVLNRWLDVTGDLDGLALLPLFLSMRAAVRAKVAAAAAWLRADEGAVAKGSAAKLEREAVDHLDFAIRALDPAPPRLIAVGGLSGTGKSRLALGLAPWVGPMPGAVVLRSDVRRKRLFGVADTDRLPAEAYDAAVTRRVYAMLVDEARRVLAAGHAAVVDAVHARPEERAAIAAAARDSRVRFDGVWLDAPLETRVARVTSRRGDASDATAEVAKHQESYDVGAIDWLRVDAGRDAGDALAAVRERLA
ncbi:bifunctional aminoglycoside phosphotransferase/ATP-binding protein [Azospirillum rugosum]|uniref:Aminoglycoside phosphotransferase family enzyme/predicted kinase n=1 Tax=Azospirillum rugosum TaxID=416170 RepID=A0ABS4SD26_9PROT|nr:bifunctional aminoglycoside phosphotransferase/ATP-binding protein [Azospirillum rugosum]MBP2290473.1 aminoglycoside phosphotransferase family enzyme/predicted kinase [Azospirillum rugosum]MDQ0525361.1 aminoglycoside phosphotransferase family enzyme/predicted kinase [Azospirillum rugosum]